MGGKSETVAQAIRRRVLSGHYPPGSRLRQDDLAAEFGVSITPVREALRVLESEQFVTAEPNRGVRVADRIDIDVVRAAYVVRRSTETFAVRRACSRLSAHDLDDLGALLDAPTPQPQRANHDFHFAFYRRCGVPGLAEQIERMWAMFPWDLMLQDPTRRVASQHEHRAILAAARTGDPDAVVAAFEVHLAGGMASLSRRLTGEPGTDPFDTL